MAENKKWSEVGEISSPSGTTMLCTVHTAEGSGDPNNRLIDADSLNYLSVSGGTVTGDVIITGNITSSEISGENNNAVGENSLRYNTGSTNTAFGTLSMASNVGGSSNTAIGYFTLVTCVNGNNNTAIGNETLAETESSENTAVGSGSLSSNSTGEKNTAVGYYSLQNNTIGHYNTAIGLYAGKDVYVSSPTSSNFQPTGSTYIGYNTKSYTSGSTNEIVIGYNAIGVGSNTVTIGNGNIIKTILRGNVTNSHSPANSETGNNSIGLGALESNLSGNNNTSIGLNSLQNLLQGDENIAIGYFAGQSDSTPEPIEDSTKSIFIGSNSRGLLSGGINEIVIGSYATGSGSNTVTIGSTGTTGTTLQGNVIPSTDNQKTLGSASNRWSEVFAGNGTINLSDARIKTEITAFTQNELNAAKQLSKEIGIYKFLQAIEEKGEVNARKHIGLTVQKAIQIMTDNNLSPFDYGFICHDSWDATIINHPEKDGQEAWIETIREAGDLYSFRYTELLAFIARGFEERLSILENNI